MADVFKLANIAGTTTLFSVDDSGNVTAAGTVTAAGLVVSSTLDLNAALDMDVALAATGDAANIAVTVNSATGVCQALDVSITTVTTVHTAGLLSAGRFAVTSLAGDTGGDFACLELASTDGGGTTPTHVGIYTADPLDALLKVSASGKGSVTVGAMTAKSPETDAEAGYFSVLVGSTRYEVPMYAVV